MRGRMRPTTLLWALTSVSAFALAGCGVQQPDDPEVDDEESIEEAEEPVGSGTVEQAVGSSCSTTSIKPLSQQIIDEMQCMSPNGLAKVPETANLTLQPGVFPYLTKTARDKFVAALAAKPNIELTVSSMFRTVGQQYMVRRWYEQGRCGIAAAATPGNSNHESGLAVDIPTNSSWRTTLSGKGFKWFGSGDPPHFDFQGATSLKGLDVQAFQRLWNRNHPNDTISEDGDWGPQTRSRLQKSPAGGFAKGAECNAPEPPPEEEPSEPSEPNGFECSDFSASEQSCAPDGSGRGICQGGSIDFEACSEGCLLQTGNDVCMGTTSTWSCNGTTGKTKMQNGDYVATAFGCSIGENGEQLNDAGDNCIPACLSALKSSGTCASGMSGPECERAITWFVADRDRFGCGAKVRVTNEANGKSAVLMVIDAGPACWVENEVDTGVLDMSYRASDYLFNESVGFGDGKKVHVVEVSADTPLGPL